MQEILMHQTAGSELAYEPDFPDEGKIQAAFKHLFREEKGKVRRFPRSGLRYVTLSSGTTLIEQNPEKLSRGARQTRLGYPIAWLMKEGRYLARVFDGEVTLLVPQTDDDF